MTEDMRSIRHCVPKSIVQQCFFIHPTDSFSMCVPLLSSHFRAVFSTGFSSAFFSAACSCHSVFIPSWRAHRVHSEFTARSQRVHSAFTARSMLTHSEFTARSTFAASSQRVHSEFTASSQRVHSEFTARSYSAKAIKRPEEPNQR